MKDVMLYKQVITTAHSNGSAFVEGFLIQINSQISVLVV